MHRFLIVPLVAVLAGLTPAVHAAERIAAPRTEAEDAEPGIQESLDVRYCDGDDPKQTLDVFSPLNARDRPVIFFVHGGGWIIGDKDMFGIYRRVGRFFARHGYVAVMVNYRLSPKVKHPEHIRDVARAFAWTCKHISAYGGEADQIVLAGHSAGAHLVSLLATDARYLQDPELKLRDKDRAAVRGVISVSGVYRIPDSDEFVEMVGEMASSLMSMGGTVAVATSALMPSLIRSGKDLNPFRMVFGDDPNVRVEASPITHVRKGLPPFLVMHAERELPRLRTMARDFRDALEKAGAPVELCPIDGHNHNTIVLRLDNPDDPTAKTILQFLARLNLKHP
jgi:acetyl esterase/lipase